MPDESPSNEPAERLVGYRPRLSLLSLLLMTTLVGAGITILSLWREIGPLRAEVALLRKEVGALVIDDESKLHLVQLRTEPLEGSEWGWRIYVPEGASYQLNVAEESARSSGTSTRTIEPGEHVLRMFLAEGSEGFYVLRTSINGGSFRSLTELQGGHNRLSTRSSSKASDGTQAYAIDDGEVELLDVKFTAKYADRDPIELTIRISLTPQ